MKIGSLEARISDLEDRRGYETLDDGSRAKMPSGLRIGFHSLKIEHESRKLPVLQDFPEEMQTDIERAANAKNQQHKDAIDAEIRALLCEPVSLADQIRDVKSELDAAMQNPGSKTAWQRQQLGEQLLKLMSKQKIQNQPVSELIFLKVLNQ